MTNSPNDIRKVHKLADWLDTRFVIPGTSIRIGMDALIGLIPGIGDTITTGLSLYILHTAHQLNVPFFTKCRMGWNIFVDWLVGLVPLIGDIFDIAYKANLKNVRLIEKHIAENQADQPMKTVN